MCVSLLGSVCVCAEEEAQGGAGSCPVRMRAVGGCGAEDEECPLTLTLPPLTLQLPRQFRQLERGLKELQSLRDAVAKLQRCCGVSRPQGAPRGHAPEEEAQQDQPGDAPRAHTSGPAPLAMADMQQKMSRMSASLRNARAQISTLQGQVGQLIAQSEDTLEAAVNSRVQNITGLLDKLSNTCHTNCPLQAAPQCECD